MASIELHRSLGFEPVGTLSKDRVQARPLARQRADATHAGAYVFRILPYAAVKRKRNRLDQTKLLSNTRSTRSSSWPRRMIRPVADMTL